MSAVESAQQAARLTDPVGHGLGLLGMVAGAIIGAVVGALLIAGAVATGGTLLILLAVAGAGVCLAAGGLSGGQLARGIQTAAGLSHPVTGAIGTVGSPNVRIGMLPAARAVADMAAGCSGLFAFYHFPMPPLPLPPIADGAATVLFNNLPAARVTSKLVCAAEITLGCPTVLIGGPTVRMLDVWDVEAMLETGLTYLLWGSIIAAFLLTIPFGIAAVAEFALIFGAFLLAFEALGWLGDQIGPGWADILQGAFGLGAVVVGGVRGRGRLRHHERQRVRRNFRRWNEENRGRIWSEELDPVRRGRLEDYQNRRELPNGEEYGRSVRDLDLNDLRGMSREQQAEYMRDRGFSREEGVIRDPKTNEPILHNGREVPMDLYTHPDGGMVRVKPEGHPGGPRPQPHASKSVLLDPTVDPQTGRPDTSWGNEGFKVNNDGEPLPRYPREANNPHQGTRRGDEFNDGWAEDVHTDT